MFWCNFARQEQFEVQYLLDRSNTIEGRYLGTSTPATARAGMGGFVSLTMLLFSSLFCLAMYLFTYFPSSFSDNFVFSDLYHIFPLSIIQKLMIENHRSGLESNYGINVKNPEFG